MGDAHMSRNVLLRQCFYVVYVLYSLCGKKGAIVMKAQYIWPLTLQTYEHKYVNLEKASALSLLLALQNMSGE